ncbi:uncharacterized [Tachysurus ichikawai]
MNKRTAFGADAGPLFFCSFPSFLFSPSSLGCLALTHPLPAVWPAPERHQQRFTGSSFRRTSRIPASFSCTAAAGQHRRGEERRSSSHDVSQQSPIKRRMSLKSLAVPVRKEKSELREFSARPNKQPAGEQSNMAPEAGLPMPLPLFD